jgi:SAM-dependent methyltransferase
MHDTAFAIGCKFLELYSPSTAFTVVEVGSQDVNGSLRSAVPERARYIGLDAQPGKNVDIVGTGNDLPFASAIADITMATSVLEHDTFFWQTFLELCRITKDGGYIYISSPSNGATHRYPQDCWRFYPDAGSALVKWAARNEIAVELVESFVADRQRDVWNDFVAVFSRGKSPKALSGDSLYSSLGARNIRLAGSETLIQPAGPTEDQELLAMAGATLLAVERRAAAAIPAYVKLDQYTDEHRRSLRGIGSKEAAEAITDDTPSAAQYRAPFVTAYTIVDTAIGALTAQFDRVKLEAKRRETSLRRRLVKAEAALTAIRDAAGSGAATDDQVWFSVDRLEFNRITGWAVFVGEPERRLQVEIWSGAAMIAKLTADHARPHLVHYGYGDGRFGFHFEFGDDAGLDRTGLRVIARWADGEMELARLAPIAKDA